MKRLLLKVFNRQENMIFVAGTAKSGTHTLAKIWGNRLKCAHEPDSEKILDLIIRHHKKIIEHQTFENEVVGLVNTQNLDVNSSQLNFFILEVLLKSFAHAKYILTIRDPYTWLDSFINHSLYNPCSGNWNKLRDLRFRPDLNTHAPEEQILKAHNLYSLDGYLKYWYYHNKTVIERVPVKKLLIIRTDQIEQNLDRLARFAGLTHTSEMVADCHEFSARKKFNILAQLNPDYLARKIEQHCGELTRIYFPEIKSFRKVFDKPIQGN